MLLTIAAAFMLLPTLVAYQIFPDLPAIVAAEILPKLDPAIKGPTAARIMRAEPMLLVLRLFFLYGHLAIIAVATDYGRSTVGGALQRAFMALPRVIVAGIGLVVATIALIAVASIILGILIALVAPASVVNDLRTMMTISSLVLIPFIWAAFRLCLVAPIAVAEHGGPWVAVRESWRSTRGHAAAIAVLFLFALLSAFSAQLLVGLVVESSGRAIDAMLGGHIGRFIATVIGGAVGAIVMLYLTMMVVSIWRRLREPGHTLHAHPHG